MYNRIIEKSIQTHLFKGKIIILYGPRQVGKTTLVKKILNEFNGEKKYIQCDIPSQRAPISKPEPEELKKFFGNAKLVVIDEAQLITNIGIVLKTFVDTYPDIQIIATGSSSFDLANKIKEPLTGRVFEYVLYPLSLEEVTQTKDLFFFKAHEEYIMRYGWYPGIIDLSETEAKDQLELLQTNNLYKDIYALENIKKPVVLEGVVNFLAFHIGSTLTINSIANELQTSAKTVERYIDLLEKMFVIIRLRGFSRNLHNEIKKGFKIYFIDIGLRNSIINNHNTINKRNDIGGLFENFFVVERIKYLNNHKIHANNYFWKTYNSIEVDYIEERDGNLFAFECKYTKQSSRSLKIFESEYIGAKTTIVTKENYINVIKGE